MKRKFINVTKEYIENLAPTDFCMELIQPAWETVNIYGTYEEYEETLNYNIENDSLKEEEKSEYKILDFNLYSSTDTQKEFLNDTARLITKFHEQTHKENNFKLDEDNEHYLDLTLDEVISLNIMLNEYSEEEMTEIFGSYKLDSKKIDSSIKSLYDKLIVYYMNAKEKSYISDIIKDEEKKKIFEDIEEKVLRFNQDTNKKNNNEIKKDKFYQYITRGSSEDYYYDDLYFLYQELHLWDLC